MDSIKEIIREKLRIEDVIASHITLVPLGKNYKACCPFHHEKTPSLHINTDKQMFYCFGCKKGGDIFSFVQEIEHLDFKEALALLAEKAGVDLRHSKELSLEMRQKKSVLQIHEYAARFYQLLLSNQPNVIQYLEKRGLISATIKTWRIGYAPDGFQQLVNVLRKKGFSDEDLVASGLAIRGERGLYDRFRGRIMFPITDNQGNIIAFTGRVVPGTAEASREGVGKYINSPETIVYHKSSALFGFSYAKKQLAEKKSAILVEGQFDTILLHQNGYSNTIGLSGTACTEKHIEQLQRFVQELIIATDSDRAGIQSAHKIATIGYQFECDVSVIVLPEGKDPADILSENPLKWEEFLKSRKDYLLFHADITADQSLRDRIGSVETHVFPVLARLQNHVRRDAKLQSVANSLKVSHESIRKEFQKFLQITPQETRRLAPNVVSESLNPLMIQIEEFILIRKLFQHETGFWFADHQKTIDLLNKYPISVPLERDAQLLVRYQSLDSVAWKIRLDTIWIRTQQIVLEHEINQLRQEIAQTDDYQRINDLQQRMIALRTQKDELIRSLAE